MDIHVIELLIILFIFTFAVLYFVSKGESVYKFITNTVGTVYDKYAPFSYKNIRKKVKELGQEYTFKEYVLQLVLFGGGALLISYL